MKILTQKERHDVYIRALEIFNTKRYTGMCACVTDAYEEMHENGIVSGTMKCGPVQYPELFLFEPEYPSKFWIEESNTAFREIVLTFCIEMTKE